MQECPECKGTKKLVFGLGYLCADEIRDPGDGLASKAHYERYDESVTYVTKDGTEKVKKDFVSK